MTEAQSFPPSAEDFQENIAQVLADEWNNVRDPDGHLAAYDMQDEARAVYEEVVAPALDTLRWLHAEAMWHAEHHRVQADTHSLALALQRAGFRSMKNQVDAMARKIREQEVELGEFRAEAEARAEAFDDYPHGDCTDPPPLQCSDAGCPEHGSDGAGEEDDELPEEFHELVRESDKELAERLAVDPELERLRAVLRGDEALPATSSWLGPEPGADVDLFVDTVQYVLKGRHAAQSGVQRNVRVSFTKAGQMLHLMEMWGLVGPKQGSAAREVLAPADAVEDIVAAIRTLAASPREEGEGGHG